MPSKQDSRDAALMHAKDTTPSQKKKKGFKGFFSFLSKREAKDKKELSTKEIKLGSDFAENVLDLELKLDSGNFDIRTVNSLM